MLSSQILCQQQSVPFSAFGSYLINKPLPFPFPTFLLLCQISGKERMWQILAPKPCFAESIKALEADVHHANSLAASLPSDCRGKCIRMKLNYSPFAPLFLHLIEWMNFSCTDGLPSFLGLLNVLVFKVRVGGIPSKGRKATLREFYVIALMEKYYSKHSAVIYPSLRQLKGEVMEMENSKQRRQFTDVLKEKRGEAQRKLSSEILEREEECGICLEICTKIVLPNCGHSMCISCFHDWNGRSQSCPFCRGSLKRITPTDLWILPTTSDIVDTETVVKENLLHFYLYIENLPVLMPETRVCTHDFML